jgi:pimeloyl-ACP methyl ester carboxylesterase
VGAMTHVQDIASLIEFEELDDVILCAHSAGAHPVMGVAEQMPERIRHLIFLDGCVPQSGESVNDVLGDDSGVPQLFRELAAKHDGISIPPTVFTAADFGVTEPEDAAWVSRRLTPHPLRCFEEPVVYGDGVASVARKTFVRSEQFPGPYGARLIDRFEQDPAWETQRWDVGHNSMVIVPEDVVSLLVDAAA